VAFNTPALAADLEDLQQRIAQLEKKIEEKKETGPLGAIADKVTFSGALELDYSYTNPRDITNKDSDSTSELDIGTAELGVEMKFHEWVTGKVVLKGENLSTDDKVFWDEATVAIGKEGFPAYFIAAGGHSLRRFQQPSDQRPITKDLYEVSKAGATVGSSPAFLGLDLSATAYKGEILADKAHEAGYGWAETPIPIRPDRRVSSYILNVSLAPFEGLR
jgi:hypothetical protein